MRATYKSSRILQPVQIWFIALSLCLALLLNMLPTRQWLGMPDWVALVLCFWSVREWRKIGMGWSFLFGLAMDVADGAMLGQHALAYVLISYGATLLSRRMLWFPLSLQALHVLPLFILGQSAQILVRMVAGGEFPGWGQFFPPLLSTLLWGPITLLLLIPQYRPVDRDQNRPI